MDKVSYILAALGTISTNWSLGYEGIQPGWAFFGFLFLAAGVVLSFIRWFPLIVGGRRAVLIGLRILAFAIVLTLLVKPILNLTINEPVPQTLVVLQDTSESMNIVDKRDREEDIKRVAIAANVPEDVARNEKVSRWDIVRKVASNSKLNLWPRLSKLAELKFYSFAAEAIPGCESGDAAEVLGTVSSWYESVKSDGKASAIGGSLRQAMQNSQGRPVGGVLLITDGANNSGISPLESAAIAKEQGIPLYIYGVGVTSAPDLAIKQITLPKLAFAKERLEIQVTVQARNLKEKTAVVSLTADGVSVGEQSLAIANDGDYVANFHFVPETAGEAVFEASVEPLTEEASTQNNGSTAKVRVTDTQFNVLFIEEEPRWDFRYLLDYLERDRRLKVGCVMIRGEPNLDQHADSPFLAALPSTLDDFFKYQVIILGDVDPADLGEDRMQMIASWVEAGGGIIFLAGPEFNPSRYSDTPLEPLLPVVPDPLAGRESKRQKQPFKLALTALGKESPYLQMAADPEENLRIWEQFPGVRWTAPVARLKPGAEVLLVDPRPERESAQGPAPVFAMQSYAGGESVYLGTDETYLWRSKTGERYYSILWGQIMQSLALELLGGGSGLTQLRADRKEYSVGDRVTVSGNAYSEGYEPYLAPAIEGKLKFDSRAGQDSEVPFVLAGSGEGNHYSGDFTPKAPGIYRITTDRDPETTLEIEVIDPKSEFAQISMNEGLLKGMAESSGGRFLREEDLDSLPKLFEAQRTTVSSFKTLEIYRSGWWICGLFVILFAEWFIRRLAHLK